MVEEHIKKYVKERLKAGVPRSHIEEVLSVMGLTKEEIADAFKIDETEESEDIEDLFITSIESAPASKSTSMENAPETPQKETMENPVEKKPEGGVSKGIREQRQEKPVPMEVPKEEPHEKPTIVQPIEETKPIKSATEPTLEQQEPPKIEPLKEAVVEQPVQQPHEEVSEPLEKPIIEPLTESEKRKLSKETKEEKPSVEPAIKKTPKPSTEATENVSETTPPTGTPAKESSVSGTTAPSGFIEYLGKEEKRPVEIPPVTPTKQFAGYKPTQLATTSVQQPTTETATPSQTTQPSVTPNLNTPETKVPPGEQTQTAAPEIPKVESVQQPIVRPSSVLSKTTQIETKKSEKKRDKMINPKLVMIPLVILVLIGGLIGGWAFLSGEKNPEPQTGLLPKPIEQVKKISVSCDATQKKLIITNEGSSSINTRSDGLTILVAGETYEDTSGKIILPGNSTEYSWDIIESLAPGVEGVVFGESIPVTNFTC